MSESAESVIRAAQRALIHGGQFLETLPKAVLKIGKGRLWGKLKPRGREPFGDFSDFATHPLPDGLGCDIGRLIDLCRGHDTAVKFLEAQRGREQKETVVQGSRTDLTSLQRKEVESGGNGSAYLLRRLARLGDDWIDRYEAGEFPSVRQAAIAAGIVKVPTVLEQLRKLWAKASAADRRTFLKEATDGR